MVETSEGTLDIAALKVAELKEELSKRGLPTNGLKKDLAERLRGAVEAQAKVEDAPIPSAESTEEQPAVVEEDVGKDDAVQQTVSNSLKPSAEEIAVSSNAAEVVHAPVEGIQSEEPIANDQEELETNDVQIMPIASAGVQDGAKVADDEKRAFEADEVPMNVNEDRPNETNDRADRIGEDLAGADVEEVELGVDTEVDIDIPTANEEADVVDIPADIENTDVAMKDEEKKLTSYHHDGISPHSDPPLMLLPDKASAAKALSDPDRELRELSKPSKAVYISGLVRPLTLPSFKAKMEDYGALEEDDSIWLDGVKTHAYVTYQQVEAATKAMEDMSGTTYPPDTGREIQVQYIPSEIVKQCIFIEELAWQEERGKMELRARKSDQEDSLVYSLHRQEGIPISQRIEPKASSLHTVNQRNAPLAGRVQLGTGHHSSQARLEWGVGSSNGNTYDRYGRGSPQDYSRRDYRSVPGRRDDFGSSRDDRGGYRRADRGSSRADERVREVEARILAERQRGERPVHRDINRDRLRSPPYSNDRSYGAPSMNKERWSRDRDEDYTRSSYNDRRREYSPPPPRREYAESDRDEFGRDRHRRE